MTPARITRARCIQLQGAGMFATGKGGKEDRKLTFPLEGESGQVRNNLG